MILSICLAALVVAFAVIAFARKPDELVRRKRASRILLIAAVVVMVLDVALWAMFGIGEMAGGDMSGISHLVPAALIALLMFLVRRRPFEGGILFVIIGIAVSIFFLTANRNDLAAGALAASLTGGPLLAAGVLLLVAALLARRGSPSPGAAV